MDYNKVILAGRLTRDPELRFTPKGSAICNVGLAVGRKWNQDGEKKEETSFFDCVAFGKIAELVAQYTKKGHPLFVDGRLRQESWEDKQTQAKRSKIVVVIENMQLMGSKSDSAPKSAPAPAPAAASTPEPSDSQLPGDSEVPF